jgi:hypothetical protein
MGSRWSSPPLSGDLPFSVSASQIICGWRSSVWRSLTIWNQTIPDHLRGRLAGIEMVSYTTGPLLGNAESGIVASLFSIRTSIVSGGILCMLGTGLMALALPAFVSYDGRMGRKRKQEEEAARLASLRETTV